MKRILIVRLSAIGDCIVTTPMLNALRDCFPRVWIGWVTEPAAAQLLQGHRGLDELIVVPRRWMKKPSNHFTLRQRLRNLRCDLTIDPQGLTKSSVLAWYSGARQRIGFAPPRGRELSKWLNNVLIQPTKSHIVEQQLELLRPLNIEAPERRFCLPLEASAERSMDSWIESRLGNQEFAVINPGAGWASRIWPEERFGQVARYLGQRLGIPTLVVWSGEEERRQAETIVELARRHAQLAPETTLPELACLLRRARLYVGADTGPTHLAAAFGTPCVALCGPTNGAYSGPYGSQHIVLQAHFDPSTQGHRRIANNDAMCTISTEAVCAACETSIARKGQSAA